MSERDELAALLFTTDNSKSVSPWSEWEHSKNEPRLVEYVYAMADALIRSGYTKPRQVNTVEELDALPFESVVRDEQGHVLERWGGPEESVWVTVMVNAFIPPADIALPATVLYTPESES